MKYYRISAKLKSPMVIHQSRQSDSSETLSYLPGSTLRGALAAKYLREIGNAEDENFRMMFIEQPVCFPNLLPTDKQDAGSRILPLTAVSCKRNPGFHAEGNHGVADHLALKLLQRLRYDVESESCPICEQDMKGFPGFWNGNIDAPCRFQPTMLIERHTGIDRDTGTIANGIFFLTQAMADYKDKDKQQYLCNTIQVDEKQHEVLKTFIEGTLFVGADRTSGKGEIELSYEMTDDSSCQIPDIEEWNRKFKEKLANILKDAKADDLLFKGHYFSIKLESDAILVDEFLRPASDVEISFGNQIESVVKVCQSRVIRGWNSAWGLPKPDDLGLSMGSIFLYKYPGDDLNGLKQYLSELVKSGIGLRREEGFGRISVCEQIHTEEVL